MDTSAERKDLIAELLEIQKLYLEALNQLDILAGMVNKGRIELAYYKKEAARLLGDSNVSDSISTKES